MRRAFTRPLSCCPPPACAPPAPSSSVQAQDIDLLIRRAEEVGAQAGLGVLRAVDGPAAPGAARRSSAPEAPAACAGEGGVVPHAGHLLQLVRRGVQHPGQRAEPLQQLVGQGVHVPLGDGDKTAAAPAPGDRASPRRPGPGIPASPAAGVRRGGVWVCQAWMVPFSLSVDASRENGVRPGCAHRRVRDNPPPPGGRRPLSKGGRAVPQKFLIHAISYLISPISSLTSPRTAPDRPPSWPSCRRRYTPCRRSGLLWRKAMTSRTVTMGKTWMP